jgi:exodeoxyribonuclease V alpha subunit
MVQLAGIVSDITFRNEENGFTVLKLATEKDKAEYCCVGTFPTIEKGISISAKGDWQTHNRFGRQFHITAYEHVRPTSVKGIEKLLGSGLIPGIGPSRAEKILAKFGLETLDIIDTTPERLLEVDGIGIKRLHTIKTAWEEQKSIRGLALFLQEFNISLNLIFKIHKTYGEKAREIISTNPYVMVDDIWGVGFIKADLIAQRSGFKAESYQRIKAGISHVLMEAVNEGHVFLFSDDVIDRAREILNVPRELVLFSVDHLIAERKVIQDEERIYLPLYHRAETEVAHLLAKHLQDQQPTKSRWSAEYIDTWLQAYIEQRSWEGDKVQIAAVKKAIQEKIVLLTGGPGTGKTTTLQVIVTFFLNHQKRIALAAPTGRAAQRMGSIAGCSAKTIHRLLEFRPGKEGFVFGRNAQNPLEAEILIVDECSMVDLLLLRNLLCAVQPGTTVIFVGDSNQLPSVGAGNVLNDCIRSAMIPHVHLTTIFRQAARSRIITAAHEILHNTVPHFENVATENCFFIQKEDPVECRDMIVDLLCHRLPKRYGIDPIRDIQVLSPMHKGELGTQELNRILQHSLNKSPRELTRGSTIFRCGDKVMQVQNNYDREVFNGDIGSIVEIIEERGVAVDFDGRVVHYESRELDELVHAYCITIHKSQGCEFKTVIIPLLTQHYIMLQRTLLYTALTRARDLCIIVGMRQALFRAVKNDESLRRNTYLAERLRMSVTAGA